MILPLLIVVVPLEMMRGFTPKHCECCEKMGVRLKMLTENIWTDGRQLAISANDLPRNKIHINVIQSAEVGVSFQCT